MVTPQTITLSAFTDVCCATRSANRWFTAGVQLCGSGTSRPLRWAIGAGGAEEGLGAGGDEVWFISQNAASNTSTTTEPTACLGRMAT